MFDRYRPPHPTRRPAPFRAVLRSKEEGGSEVKGRASGSEGPSTSGLGAPAEGAVERGGEGLRELRVDRVAGAARGPL